jgi:lipopolysaccharide/colanic/teichoic acid biosynthesis glycosyltransferase
MSAPASEHETPYGIVVPAPRPVASASERRLASPAAVRGDVAWRAAKRMLDIALALLGVIAFAPVMLIVALLIKLDSSGPVLFRQRRYGLGQRTFTVLKFRTMTTGASSDAHRDYIAQLATGPAAGGLKKLTTDARITRFGALLRKSSLDELPQLFNVLSGRMSLVGPRPAIEYELEHYDYDHFARFDVKPGLTGLWQVSGRSKLGFNEMLALDAEYARTTGPLTDAKILLRTPVEIFRGRCA